MTAESSRSGQSNLVTVESSLIIDAPVARVWAEVANFNNVAAWHPDVTESQLEAEATGHSPGEIRSIKLRNGQSCVSGWWRSIQRCVAMLTQFSTISSL